jgi:two-component system chemotaxis sensor kinase CheA
VLGLENFLSAINQPKYLLHIFDKYLSFNKDYMSELDLELVTSFLDEATDLLTEWERLCLLLEKAPDAQALNALFRIAHNIKGSSRAVGLNEVGEFIHLIEDVIVSLKDNKSEFNARKLKMFLGAHLILSDWFMVLRMETSYVHPYKDFLKEFFNEEKVFIDEQAVELHEDEKSEEVSQKVQSIKNVLKDEVLRVSTKKIDGLLNLIGELSIQQSILENSMESLMGKNQDSLVISSLNLGRKITKEIYSTAFGLRMTPVGGIYQRLERAIKDLSRDLGKNIEVELNGSEVEIDKTILDKLIDPLTHIVRNSVDHGIEQEEERRIAAKPPAGKITITSLKEGDGVEIHIKDDGKGLNQKRILEKAIEKGLVKNAEGLTKEEIFGLIFLPGFSTAERVTNVSGRGVGMDVVMKTLEEINGKIFIASDEGKGTKFKIVIPTSLSIVDSLIVSVAHEHYVLPINVLQEVVDVRLIDLKKHDSVYVHRGEVLPFIHLREVLCEEKRSENVIIPILVTKVHGNRMAIGVDKIIGQHQSVVRTLSTYFERSFAISGGTILPSGEPGLILNIPAIVEKYFNFLMKKNEASA